MDKKYKPIVAVVVLVILVAVLGIVSHVVMKYIPSGEKMDLNEYYGEMADGEIAIVLGTEKLDERGLVDGDRVYLPLNVVNTYLNQRYYWDSANQQVLYATPSELTTVAASSESGDQVWLKDDTVYLNLTYIQQYTDIDAYISKEPYRIAIQYQFDNIKTVTVKKNTSIRYRGGIKSPVVTSVKKGAQLRLIEELDNWDQVATDDGYIGYIDKKNVGKASETTFDRNFEREQYSYLTMDGKVNMVWHQVTSTDANAYFADATANMTGVNVISPTWFYLLDTSGNIANISSADYVAQAHEKGLKVWGLIDNFTQEVSTTETLSNTAARQNIISQLIQAATSVGMDGINVDFESLSEDVGIHFLEFLRELSIECHKNNLVLSVDNPVPEDFTSHYDRAEQGRVVDYVIIMGYDEHYVGSEAGSVASLPWVEQGIQDTLAEVPAERVINAVPFYTRLWRTTGGNVTSEAIGMDQAQQVISENNVETYWDKTTSQNYGKYDIDNSTYQIWIEDSQSIAEKVKLVSKYNLAGVSAWKLGFENSGIWQVISDNLN
ncbi:glycosyl hydrolase family 18 [Ruminococcus sp. AF37-6AT]|jgi:spore germination protein YaaH|nr:glycosyl hydrolase family 18 protein [uncultured Blautia sp.]RGI59411.1 glycosyl hydrolase family 18 [Ruminococcus sp. TM10-9AT]RGW21568.1 glycosyl hydrolase family 18 [Ruminococcus sp. AF13-37]RGW24222.1 glycosyl hydrolase family 18 [Ruminococcus sp. AF13-28]RHD91944.1 glycosyl hydrolase family 18 [Ruminococcus sp. AM30-15AC]RHL44759.1 glycosyl hydrolase family 18 [Ruminococcus sp. AF37-6AT]RHO87969.1 glycosyl hydrolase family 18 [Ruminococcus sp. AF42-9BH]RHQ96232.1 glycosyl hydrolase f